MGFFIVIACSWLVVAGLDILASRRRNEMEAEGILVPRSGGSAYLNPPRPY
ncbi:hypothetical protein [Methylobacterium dankookense]|uniref:Uncharacterized protein n=1 Tax=Methylobacterium dankookense TaxID=560405 RepID=A0A564FYQ1_9HYPH|nr:hypothetical protein [Methylobacterium dankookense]GJD56674.1 hypothetical protein IFDJLNFL_2571 [Methylobacterium dankookense]VUF13112.1 hypothetical protein MTDSW087_02810 [Methylobacterium dankookense]